MNNLSIEQIIQVLGDPTVKDLRPFIEELTSMAVTSSLTSALKTAENPATRSILCTVLGKRKEPIAISALVTALDDENPDVRASAADALAKVGTVNVGAAVLARFQNENDNEVRQMLAICLGAVKYRPAIPVLIESLRASSGMLRGCAAWSLGEMKAREAVDELEQILLAETNEYAKDRIGQALIEISSS